MGAGIRHTLSPPHLNISPLIWVWRHFGLWLPRLAGTNFDNNVYMAFGRFVDMHRISNINGNALDCLAYRHFASYFILDQDLSYSFSDPFGHLTPYCHFDVPLPQLAGTYIDDSDYFVIWRICRQMSQH